jgi:hypothetical protein
MVEGVSSSRNVYPDRRSQFICLHRCSRADSKHNHGHDCGEEAWPDGWPGDGHGKGNSQGKTTETEKTGRIASHALQAWTIMGGQGALFLLSPQKKGEQHRVRYYELDAGKGHFLGHVPFAEAKMAESTDLKCPWAFAVAGNDPPTDAR